MAPKKKPAETPYVQQPLPGMESGRSDGSGSTDTTPRIGDRNSQGQIWNGINWCTPDRENNLWKELGYPSR